MSASAREKGPPHGHTPWWIWVVLWGLLVLSGMLARWIANRIDGPDTTFFYRNAFDAEFNSGRAQQFAALLNYEASRLATQSSGL